VLVCSRRATIFCSDPFAQRFAGASKMCSDVLVAQARSRIIKRLLDFRSEPFVICSFVCRQTDQRAAFLDLCVRIKHSGLLRIALELAPLHQSRSKPISSRTIGATPLR
jgi:hypothetical protein